MPVPDYQGKLLSAFGDPRIVEAWAVTPGFLTTDAADAMQLFFNAEKGGITEDPQGWTAGDGSMLAWGAPVTLNYPLYSSDLAIMANFKLLGYKSRFNMFMKDEGGRFYNWIPVTNGDYKTTPDGTTDFTCAGTKWTCNEKERKIDVVCQGFLGQAQADKLMAISTSYIATGSQVTGGVTRALTAITSSRALRVLEPGFHTVEWDPGSTGTFHDVGELASCEVSLEFTVGVGDGSLQRNQKVVTAIKYDAKWKTEQFNATESRAANANTFTDGTLQISSYAGEVLQFVNARGLVKQVFAGNDSAYLEGSFTGEVSLSACNFTAPLAPVFTLNHL